jgi:Ca2+-binding RTX toxin-like protein
MGDGAFSLNTQEGDDTVDASSSTLPLVIFGWDGSDTITGGKGNDIIFGDRGRVDYLDESGDHIKVVTRLGSAPENITGTVVDAGDNSLVVELDEDLTIDVLPTEDEGLRGLVVWINEGTGAGQSRVIVYNTENWITVDSDWSVLPDETSGFRITGTPSDQTDGQFLDAAFLFTSDPAVGGDDIIWGGMGEDLLIGGAGGDSMDGGSDADLLFGDNVKLDRTGEIDGVSRVDDFTSSRFRALVPTESAIYDMDGVDQIDNDTDYLDPAGAPAWANWDILMSEDVRFDSYGSDYLAGGAGDDMIFGQLGDDTIQGDGAITMTGLAPVDPSFFIPGHTALDPVPLVFDIFESVTDGDDYIEGGGGGDTIYGGLGQDDLIGGSSDLFSLADPEDPIRDRMLRQDGGDTIFGGAGIRVDRNHMVTDGNRDTIVQDEEHARDADMILGDNGNIFRLVSVDTDGVSSYLEFNYDQSYSVGEQYFDRGDLRIIPRVARILDYTPGGFDIGGEGFEPNPGDPSTHPASNDIGGSDKIHGESGDDFIYGMVGGDVLFGDSQDDDIIGGYGNDWISGGTGQDGILGDDGRIYTSRNSDIYGEPLYGIEAIPTDQLGLYIATGGDHQNANINIDGQLKKTVNLTPFKLGDPAEQQYTPTYDPLYADDIIYGGWGSDFIHGGDGDDAISGAEALEPFYTAHDNPRDVLGFREVSPGEFEFLAYNENDPWRKILVDENGAFTTDGSGSEFLLNFNADDGLPSDPNDLNSTRTDGDDVIFGDLGNDWIVGGTGEDHLYGGRGDDLINADDDHDSTLESGDDRANNEPDPDPTYEDIAYGGAGRDVIIGNTGGDRLIDWGGEFNSYVVPFSPFGIATVSRSHQPDLTDYLYQLSASDGADPTRDTDEDLPDNDPRNGEPFGELGLVLPQDDDWKDQTGGPDDPQPGNDKGKKDVKTTASTEPTVLIFNEVTGELIVNGEVAADEDWIIEI